MAAILYLLTAVAVVWNYGLFVMPAAGGISVSRTLSGLWPAFLAFLIFYSLVTDSPNAAGITFGLRPSFSWQRLPRSPSCTAPTCHDGDRIDAGPVGGPA